MSLIPTWPFVAGALVVGLAGGFAVEHTRLGAKIDRMNADWAEELRVREVKRAADERNARSIEQQMAERIGLAEQEKTDEIARIRADSARAIAGLSNRPARIVTVAGGVPPAAPACAGATGASLAREDASFLIGEAGFGAEQQEALAACYKWADAVEGKSPQQ